MAPNYVMIVALITVICFSLSFGDDAMLPTSHNNLITKSNCNESCGNVNIPFPFGMSRDCTLRDQFLVTCDYSLNPPQPFLENSSIEITSISLAGQLNILKFISRDCYRDGINTNRTNSMMSLPSLLTVNNTVNSFIAVGCDTYATVQGRYTKFGTEIKYLPYITGCMSMCYSIDEADDDTCSGVGCCKTSIPKGARNVNITLSSYYKYDYTNMTNNPSCSYAFVVEDANFSYSKSYLESLRNKDKLPLVLDWVIGEGTCKIAKKNSATYGCKSKNSDCYDSSIGYRCSCMQGYDGNPYLIDGCQDINECADPQPDYRCVKNAICTNTDGSYACTCHPDFRGDGYTECNRDNPQRKIQNIYLIIGITAGVALIVSIVFGWSYTAFQRRKMSMMKRRFFQENGGLVLLQLLKVEEGSSNTNTVKIFTAEELEKATNGFDKDRIVGQGGFGTVYKGYLKDNCIVAIKKSKIIDRNQIEQFINEVLVLSQINHRNVVKLLGCCLETEVPLLVYEFIINGTLSEHLHDKLKVPTLSLDIHLKVVAETAGVLSYLHSSAYPPIIHRDIKSVNTLLDKNYTAKVSDFGASRLVPADQTELSTLVQGTLGYLDPEYLQTNQLNEKSDVYSFGVLLIELLTGRKALCFEIPEEERCLAQYFISSVEKGHLFDILDNNIVCDEEVAAELEAGSKLKHSWAQTDQQSEEIESLLPGFGYEYSEHSIHIDGVTSHVSLPFPGGRVGCCKTPIPNGAKKFTIKLSSYFNHTYGKDENTCCSYAYVNITKLPLVVDWVIGEETCEISQTNSTTYGCKSNNRYCDEDSNGYRCFCMQGYDVNPYLMAAKGYYTKFGTKIEYLPYITGCMSMCNSIDDVVHDTCSGVGCCKTSIPKGAWNVTITLRSYYNYNDTDMKDDLSCSYAFVVDQANFSFSMTCLSSLQKAEKLPLVLDWAIGEETCEIAKRNSTTYGCKSKNSDCQDNSNGYRCSSMQGYDGNPYLIDGCQDINECVNQKPDYRCVKNAICNNTDGSYTCTCRPDFSGDGYTESNRDNPQRKLQNIYLVIGTFLNLFGILQARVEKGHLFDILDDNIVCDEGNAGQLKNVAVIAQRCLNIKGEDRPTMKEVAAELEAGSKLKHSWAQTDQQSEEIESLLPGFGYEYSEHSIHVDSITSHVTIPFPGGR
ncbi:hypothetical protein KY284_037578 [Solanum tuberosum]|nr:hypothetical protein KY284_037578 [Solanum tuberosum]